MTFHTNRYIPSIRSLTYEYGHVILVFYTIALILRGSTYLEDHLRITKCNMKIVFYTNLSNN